MSTQYCGAGFSNPVVVLDDSTRKKVGRHYEYGDTPYDEEIRLLLREFDSILLINFDDPPCLLRSTYSKNERLAKMH